jgi:hypothetical protein
MLIHIFIDEMTDDAFSSFPPPAILGSPVAMHKSYLDIENGDSVAEEVRTSWALTNTEIHYYLNVLLCVIMCIYVNYLNMYANLHIYS